MLLSLGKHAFGFFLYLGSRVGSFLNGSVETKTLRDTGGFGRGILPKTVVGGASEFIELVQTVNMNWEKKRELMSDAQILL